MRLDKLPPIVATVLVKVSTSPGGSVKDRMAIKMIEDAERQGQLKPGGTIVEPTSGNTGAGLAMAAAVKGYDAVFVVPDKVSREKIDLLKAYGAKVVITPTNVDRFDPRSYYKVAERIANETGAYRPNQYFNPANPQAHYESTGPEIWRQTKGRITHFVAGMGTGGTISGIARFLKEQNPKVQIIGADRMAPSMPNRARCTSKVEGIGGTLYRHMTSLVDCIVTTDDSQAFLTARRLAREEGILAGGSSGASTFAALQVANELDESAVVVVLLPDGGRGYLSKMYSDDWMSQNGVLEQPETVPGSAEKIKENEVATQRNNFGRQAGNPRDLVLNSRGVPNAF